VLVILVGSRTYLLQGFCSTILFLMLKVLGHFDASLRDWNSQRQLSEDGPPAVSRCLL
jgi:hypothetical protein